MLLVLDFLNSVLYYFPNVFQELPKSSRSIHSRLFFPLEKNPRCQSSAGFLNKCHYPRPKRIEKEWVIKFSGGLLTLESGRVDHKSQPNFVIVMQFWICSFISNSYINLIYKKVHNDTECQNVGNSSTLPVSTTSMICFYFHSCQSAESLSQTLNLGFPYLP